MHLSVLKKEILEYLDPQPNQNFIDCTINGGGHTSAILEKTRPEGRVLGIEADKEIYRQLKLKTATQEIDFRRLVSVNDNFVNLRDVVEEKKFISVSGILFDLGFSSWHIDQSGRGFSFGKEEFLDMRYSPEKEGITAWEIINKWPKENLKMIFKDYGEERFSGRIAEKITEERKKGKINTTLELVETIKKAVPPRFQKGRIHFATRVFQGLRIEVNDELENLKKVLPQTINLLRPGGKVAVISFHSLEDRIVKHFFKDCFRENKAEILTKKPVTAGEEEIKNNPRSRSAKLRVIKII